ncbi:MAG: oxidoreductase [Phycisphaeraceae bacterium]|nr:oxidoreductase [Phycisphaeraceae bacterium]
MPSESPPLRLGIIGTWGRGYYLKDLFHQPGGRSIITAGADVSDFALEKFREYAGPDALATADYRELLSRDLDAVIVSSPDYCHEEHAVAALEAGHHIYLEKPMAITVEGCDRIRDTARRVDRKVMIGFNLRYSPVLHKAAQMLREGAVGKIRAVWMRHFVGYGSDFYFHDWHARRDRVTSLLLQKASHDLDIMHWLAGSYASEVAAFGDRDMFGGDKPDDLTCDACDERDDCPEAQPLEDHFGLPHPRRQCAFREEIDVEDNQVLILRLASGVKASYLQCHFTPDTERNYTVIGTTGRIEIRLEKNVIRLLERPNNQSGHGDFDDGDGLVSLDEGATEGGHGGADPAVADAFLDFVRHDAPPRASSLDGRMSVAAAIAATRSIREGGVQRVAPLPT